MAVEGKREVAFHVCESNHHTLFKELKVWDYWKHVGVIGRDRAIGKERRA